MLGIHDFWLFLPSALLLAIAPGPDTAYVVGRSMQLGWRGGVAAMLGISSGGLVHVFGATLGVSALLAASATAFTILKWIGAAYLCYVGITMLLSGPSGPSDAVAGTGGLGAAASLRRAFWQGALTNVLNPKVALFFLAFLPQFVDAEAPHKALAFALLGLNIICNGMVWLTAVALFTARTATRVRRSGVAMRWVNRALGGVFVLFGVRLAALQTR